MSLVWQSPSLGEHGLKFDGDSHASVRYFLGMTALSGFSTLDSHILFLISPRTASITHLGPVDLSRAGLLGQFQLSFS